MQGKGLMRTYWLINKIHSGMFDNRNGDEGNKFTASNSLPDSKHKLGSDLKRNSTPYTSSAKQKHSEEEMKSFSCSEISGYISSEINVNLCDSSQLGQPVSVTPAPAPDLLPKVRFETRM